MSKKVKKTIDFSLLVNYNCMRNQFHIIWTMAGLNSPEIDERKDGFLMNIGEIAELAGVSRATVSRYLNDGYVSKEKRERIRQIIEETGYVPSSQAQTLRTKKSGIIGVIVPKIDSNSVSRMIQGVTQILDESSYNMLLASTSNSLEKELEYLRVFKNNRVDGIILIATVLTKAHYREMAKLGCPVVVLGQKADGYSCVYNNDRDASFAAVTRLIETGCRSIAYAGVDDEDKAAGLSRYNGFMRALEAAGIKPEQDFIRRGKFSQESGYEMMKEILKTNKPIDGVFCATDNIAFGAIKAMEEFNLKVGSDIRVISVGDSVLADALSLTSVHLHYLTAGIEAAKLVIDRLSAENNIVKNMVLGYELKIRGSC